MIKMIAGVYGYREGGIIVPKDKNSEPFSLDPEREAELVACGVASYANLIIPEEPKGAGQNGDDSQDDEDSQNGDDSQNDEDSQKQKPEYSEKMKLPELQALAASYGLDAQKMRAKAEVVKLLDDYFKDDNEQPPSFGAMDPVE